MLVLSRKVGESIVIGDSIHIKVLDVSGSKIRIGIEAPPSVQVMREELLPLPDNAIQASPKEVTAK